MSIAFASIALLMLLIMGVGLVFGLFVRGRRKFGWKLVGSGFVAFVAALGVATYTFDRSGSTQAAAATIGSGTEVQQAATNDTSEASADPTATKFGADALRAYCGGYQKTLDAIREADRKFGIEGTDEKTEWVKVQDQAIGIATGQAIGAPFEEWQPVAQAENWDQQCQGLARGWLLTGEPDLLAAQQSDAETVVGALEAAYRARIGEGRDLPFTRYSAVTCEWKELRQYHFAACTLTGGKSGLRSDPYLYFVGHHGSQAVIVPFDNETRDHLANALYAGSDGATVPVGWYSNLPFKAVTYSEVRSLFE